MDPTLTSNSGAFIQGLVHLPRELVHKVLDDLSVERILQIVSHKIDFLDACVTSHFRYGRLFRSQADIDSVVDYYILFRDMKDWTRTSPSLEYSLQTYNTPTLGSWNYEERLRASLLADIKGHAQLTIVEQKVLSPWILDPCPELPALRAVDPLPGYWARWNWIKEAKKKLNTEKASHWTKAADLVSAYPGMLMLKKPLDPGQGTPRPNITHIANRFRATAKKILQDHKLVYPFTSCGHGVDGIILVPQDRYLWSFLEVIKSYPPESKSKDAISCEDLSIHDEKLPIMGSSKTSSFIYPPEIESNLKIVMDGLAQVYSGSPLRLIPRIEWPPAPLAEMGQKPVFLVNNSKFAGMHLCPLKRRAPHDPRELEWLEAFLKVVTWMEENVELLQKDIE